MISEETGLPSAQLFLGESSDRPLLSIVVPLFNEQEVFSELQLRFLELQKQIGIEYDVQIVLIDDGSADNTWALIQSFADRNSFVKGVSLSRNFGHQRALFCGRRCSIPSKIARTLSSKKFAIPNSFRPISV